jgi:RNA polymerase sigma-70 factor (ECF subfamily)
MLNFADGVMTARLGLKLTRESKKKKCAVPADTIVKQRSKSEFEELANQVMKPLYATAMRLIRNAALAEELVQETFLRAWTNFDRFKSGTNFKAWLVQILTYLYLNQRREAKKRETPVDFTSNDIPLPASRGHAETAEAVASALDRRALEGGVDDKEELAGSLVLREVNWSALYPELVNDELKNALDSLVDEQRIVFFLVVLGDLSYQECADALSIPIGTVMSRLFRARQHLREELSEYAREQRLTPMEEKKTHHVA